VARFAYNATKAKSCYGQLTSALCLRNNVKHLKWTLFLFGLLVTLITTPIIISFILKEFLCWEEPIAGPLTAIVIVFYSYFLAPKYNAIFSTIGFSLGALLAYAIPDMHFYPECHELAYQNTYLPLTYTYTTGIFALAYCIYLSKKKHNKAVKRDQ